MREFAQVVDSQPSLSVCRGAQIVQDVSRRPAGIGQELKNRRLYLAATDSGTGRRSLCTPGSDPWSRIVIFLEEFVCVGDTVGLATDYIVLIVVYLQPWIPRSPPVHSGLVGR